MFEPPIKHVSADVLRKLFNNSGYWEHLAYRVVPILRKYS